MYARKEKWPREKFGSFAIGPLLDRNSSSMIDTPSTEEPKRRAPFGQLAADSQQQAGIGSFAARGTFDDLDGH